MSHSSEILLWIRFHGLYLEFPVGSGIHSSPRCRFSDHFNLLVDIKGCKLVHADCPEDVVIHASPGPQPAFKSVSFLSAPREVQDLLQDFPDVLSSDGFTASKPRHGVKHHLLTQPGPSVFAKPWRLDPEKLAAAQAEFPAMEKAGIIPRSSSP